MKEKNTGLGFCFVSSISLMSIAAITERLKGH